MPSIDGDGRAGALFVVATPIGNLEDITLRAVSTLREVAVVVAEDTRRTRALLSHLGVGGVDLVRLDEHATARDITRVADRIERGERVALVTDAGTPVVSDPGTALVAHARARGLSVIPIPGPSAVTAALSVSGLAGHGFRFAGFLPRGGPPRREALARLQAEAEPTVLFESPRRVAETLAELAALMPARRAFIARELTKLHEELISGTLTELAEQASGRDWLGELTLVVGPADPEEARPALDDEAIDERIDAELRAGRRVRDIADALALSSGRPRRELYERVLARRRG